MATYTVSYRGKNGERIEEQFEAPDRNSLFKILADRKISAISVKDGAAPKRKKSSATAKPVPPSVLRGIMVGLVVVIALVGALYFVFSVSRGGASNEEGQKSKLIKEVRPSLQKNAEKGLAKSEDGGPQVVSVETNVVKKTPEEIEAEERAKDPLYDRHHIVAKMPVVGDPVEQLMLSVFETEVGEMPPMLPSIPSVDEDRVRRTINELSKIEKNDSEETKEAKKLIDQVKVELKKFLEDGGTVNGFLAHYYNILDSAFQERETTKEMVMKYMKQEDVELAREFYYKANERLANKGIKTLRLNKRQREHLGIEEE